MSLCLMHAITPHTRFCSYLIVLFLSLKFNYNIDYLIVVVAVATTRFFFSACVAESLFESIKVCTQMNARFQKVSHIIEIEHVCTGDGTWVCEFRELVYNNISSFIDKLWVLSIIAFFSLSLAPSFSLSLVLFLVASRNLSKLTNATNGLCAHYSHTVLRHHFLFVFFSLALAPLISRMIRTLFRSNQLQKPAKWWPNSHSSQCVR